jgi:hypothetical protein
MNLPEPTNTEYQRWLQELKGRIQHAQLRASRAVNAELILLYWQIGKSILTQQAQQGWGAKVIDQLSKDLKRAFPEMKGFSRTNLLYMRAFAEAYPDVSIEGAELLWHEGLRAIYAFDRQALSASDVIRRISVRFGIRDISVQEPDVETTIRNIYERKLLAQV